MMKKEGYAPACLMKTSGLHFWCFLSCVAHVLKVCLWFGVCQEGDEDDEQEAVNELAMQFEEGLSRAARTRVSGRLWRTRGLQTGWFMRYVDAASLHLCCDMTADQ